MARQNKIEEIARERGKPADSIVLPLVNKIGQRLTAEKLGVSQATVSKWLEDNGYVLSSFWQKGVTPAERADIEAAHDRVNAQRVEQGLPTLEEEAADELA